MADSGAGGGGGIIVFTLWYIGIAYLYYTDHYEKKNEEGTQTHSTSENSSQYSKKSRTILEQAVDILEEHVELKPAALQEPEPETKPELEPELEAELEPEAEIISLVKIPAGVQSESDFEEAADSE